MNLGKFKPFLKGAGIIVGAIVIAVVLMSLKPKTEQEESTKPPLAVRTAETMAKDQLVYSTFQGEVKLRPTLNWLLR